MYSLHTHRACGYILVYAFELTLYACSVFLVYLHVACKTVVIGQALQIQNSHNKSRQGKRS